MKVERLKIYIIQCCIRILVMYLTPKMFSRWMKHSSIRNHQLDLSLLMSYWWWSGCCENDLCKKRKKKCLASDWEYCVAQRVTIVYLAATSQYRVYL